MKSQKKFFSPLIHKITAQLYSWAVLLERIINMLTKRKKTKNKSQNKKIGKMVLPSIKFLCKNFIGVIIVCAFFSFALLSYDIIFSSIFKIIEQLGGK